MSRLVLEPGSTPPSIIPEALLLGLTASFVATLPAAARVAGAGPAALPIVLGHFPFAIAWLAGAGLAALPVVLVMGAGRLARRSWQTVAASSRYGWIVVVVWALVSLPVDFVLGTALMATTHQRALGGATLAVLALVCNIAALLIAWRVRTLLSSLSERVAVGLGAAIAALALLVVLFLILRGGRTATPSAEIPPNVRIDLIAHVERLRFEAVVTVVALAGALFPGFPTRWARAVSVAAGGGLLGLVCLAVTLLVRSPPLAQALLLLP